MLKRILALVLALALLLPCAALAESDAMIFEPFVCGDLSCLATSDAAMEIGNSTFVPAALMMEIVLYQIMNGQEPEARTVYEDCYIGQRDDIVTVIFYVDETTQLAVTYSTTNKTIAADYLTGSFSTVEQAMYNTGNTRAERIDRAEWTAVLLELVSMATGS